MPVYLEEVPRGPWHTPDPRTFQTAVSSLRLGESKFVHQPFKSGISVSHTPLALPDVKPGIMGSHPGIGPLG